MLIGEFMRYMVSGLIKGNRNFNMEIEANSEKLAVIYAKEKLGSTQGLKNSQIYIKETKKVE